MDRPLPILLALALVVVFGYGAMVGVANWELLARGHPPRDLFGAPLMGALALLPPLGLCAWLIRRQVRRPARILARDARALLESRTADTGITLPRGHALGELPAAVQALADALKGSRREIRGAMATATAQINEQKSWLETILQGLAEGVVVCNRRHQILLYNPAAVALLESPEAVGLGRPLFDVVSRAPVIHTLERLEWRQGQRKGGPADLTARFVCTNAPATRVLQGRMSLILDGRGETSAYLVTLVDISSEVDIMQQVDAVRRALTTDLRGAVGNLRAAAETLDAHSEMSLEDRRAFQQVLRSESETLSTRLEELAERFRGHALGRFPMSDLYSSDLVEGVVQRLQDLPGVTLELVGQPLWIQGDSLSLVQALEGLVRYLVRHTGARRFRAETLLGDRRVYLDLTWRGEAVPAAELDRWLDSGMGDEMGGQTLRDVLERHGIELWSQACSDGEHALLRLPMIAPSRPQFQPDGAQLPPRPEFYDFGLMREHEGDPKRAATPLEDLTFVVFDCEMTGLNPVGGDEIISIAGVRVVKGRVLTGETFEQLIHPGRPIPPSSIRFHGITDDQVRDKPLITEVLPRFKAFVGDAVMVAHNAAFDMKFISLKEPACGLRFDNPVLDTLLLSVMVEDENEDHSLDALITRYGIDMEGRHTALGDAVATAHLLVRLMERLRAQGYRTFGEVMRSSSMAAQLRQRERSISHQDGAGPAAGM
ncbi:MAG: exonuclease domain-containing protein [Ectothiorhodospira sp.]